MQACLRPRDLRPPAARSAPEDVEAPHTSHGGSAGARLLAWAACSGGQRRFQLPVAAQAAAQRAGRAVLARMWHALSSHTAHVAMRRPRPRPRPRPPAPLPPLPQRQLDCKIFLCSGFGHGVVPAAVPPQRSRRQRRRRVGISHGVGLSVDAAVLRRRPISQGMWC